MKKHNAIPGKENEALNEEENFEYPPSEDIYNQAVEVNLDPNDLISNKETDTTGKWNEKAFKEDVSGGDLDVPGSELDDDLEAIGEEDEENNYYSLGGDNHENLEENNGES